MFTSILKGRAILVAVLFLYNIMNMMNALLM